ELVGPAQQRLDAASEARCNRWRPPEDHSPGAAVDRQIVALANADTVRLDDSRVEVDHQRGAAGDRWLAHATRDDSRVGGHAATGSEDAASLLHSRKVVRRGLGANEDHVVAGFAERACFERIED